jgi:hypothetical protein
MAETINLYIDLEDGQLADLEVVARASIAFSEAVKEIAFIVDPSIEIRLELESGTEGSLSLNSIIKSVSGREIDPLVLKSVLYAMITWLVLEVGASVLSLSIEKILTEQEQISEQDVDRIANRVRELLEGKVGEKQVREIFKQLDKDPSVKGVGVGSKKGARPKVIVPRKDFESRITLPSLETPEQRNRDRSERMTLLLISPVLQNNHNKWRFLSKDGMVSADISDEEFLSKVITGEAKIPLKAGITIVADLDIQEVFKDQVWIAKKRTIKKVIKIDTGGTQSDLFE